MDQDEEAEKDLQSLKEATRRRRRERRGLWRLTAVPISRPVNDLHVLIFLSLVLYYTGSELHT